MKRTLYILLTLLLAYSCTSETVSDAKQETVQPHIYPDYLDVTVPVNIAPLCFSMADEKALLIDADYNLNYTFNKAQKRVVRAGLSNTFGFGGHNACVVFKKYEA